MEWIREAKAKGIRTLSEADSRRVLEAYHIPLVASQKVGSPAQAVTAAKGLGFPVVLKGTGSQLAHKTESDVVRLDLRSDQEVEQAYLQIQERAGDRLEAVLVQKMVRSQREFVAGMNRDPQFGPCVMFGLGGILTEVLRDVVFRVAPLTAFDAQEMMDQIKSARLLGAFRGKPAADRQALAQLLVNLGRLGQELDDVAEVDINPILLDGTQPVAVDALVVLRS
jgi:succinyl-CoA synthetase beta subunit